MERDIIVTEDGSSSLIIKEWGETFHSKHGAIQESKHVYIDAGLSKIDDKVINVLEFGFGTGLNALLTAKYAEDNHKIIHFETVEAYPLTEKEYSILNYSSLVDTKLPFTTLHNVSFDQFHELTNYFSIYKQLESFENFQPRYKCDIVYYDVFGFDYQPHLWDITILEKAYNALKENGIFVTYACKGEVNRRLKALGFKVYKVPGPPGKREMTFAVK